MTHIGNLFNQTNIAVTNLLGMNYIAADLIKNFQNLKIKIKITKLKKNGSIYLGAI